MSIDTKSRSSPSSSSSSTYPNTDYYDEEEFLVAASIDGCENELMNDEMVNEKIDQELMNTQEWSNSNSFEPLSSAASVTTTTSTIQRLNAIDPNIIDLLSNSESANVGDRQRRRAFTHRQKLDILSRYDALGSIRRASIECNVSRKQIRNWLRMRQVLADSVAEAEASAAVAATAEQQQRCRVRGGGKKFDPRLEFRLLAYAKKYAASTSTTTIPTPTPTTTTTNENNTNGKMIEVNYSNLRDKALVLAQQLNIGGFRASNGFLQRFCKRNNIKCSLRAKRASHTNISDMLAASTATTTAQ